MRVRVGCVHLFNIVAPSIVPSLSKEESLDGVRQVSTPVITVHDDSAQQKVEHGT